MRWIFAPSKKHLLGIAIIVTCCVFTFGFMLGNKYGEAIPVLNQRLVPIYKVARDDNKISITLDGTWGANYTEELLDIFAEQGITVTFFFAGYWLEKYPGLVKEIAAAGHGIGNHTYTHPHCNSLSRDELIKELETTSDLIEQLIGQRPTIFRPPYGEYNNRVISIANQLGYQVIQWSIDSLDWREPGVEYIFNRVMEKAGPGDIILMHNNAPDTANALRRLIPALQKKGLEIVPLSAMVYNDDYYIESHSGLQVKRSRRDGE